MELDPRSAVDSAVNVKSETRFEANSEVEVELKSVLTLQLESIFTPNGQFFFVFSR